MRGTQPNRGQAAADVVNAVVQPTERSSRKESRSEVEAPIATLEQSKLDINAKIAEIDASSPATPDNAPPERST